MGPSDAGDMVAVGMGEAKVTRRAADLLVAHGLGSCIALCVRDPAARVAGMAHIVLPERPARFGDTTGDALQPARFADHAVPHLLETLAEAGGDRARLKIAIVGGAQTFGGSGGDVLNIGKRNTAAVLLALQAQGLRLLAHDVGGVSGRICQLFARDGRLLVRYIGAQERELAVLGAQGGAK